MWISLQAQNRMLRTMVKHPVQHHQDQVRAKNNRMYHYRLTVTSDRCLDLVVCYALCYQFWKHWLTMLYAQSCNEKKQDSRQDTVGGLWLKWTTGRLGTSRYLLLEKYLLEAVTSVPSSFTLFTLNQFRCAIRLQLCLQRQTRHFRPFTEWPLDIVLPESR